MVFLQFARSAGFNSKNLLGKVSRTAREGIFAPKRHDKFGKIFVTSGSGTARELEFLKFSNLDWKLYSIISGQEVAALEKYLKKRVSLQADLLLEDKHRKKCLFDVQLNLPFLLENMPGKNLKLLETLETHEIKSFSNLETGKAPKYINEVVAFMAFATREGQEGLSLPIEAAATICFLDDFLENSKLQNYGDLLKMVKTWIEILSGNIPEGQETSTCMFVENTNQICWSLRSQALKSTGINPIPFIEAFVSFLEASLVESSKEWITRQQTASKMFQRLQPSLRTQTVGCIVVLEALALSQRISLKSSIRESFLFREFQTLAGEHGAKTNDLFSFKKEFETGWAANSVSLLHLEKNLPLKDTLQLVVDELNDINSVLLETGEFLLQLHNNDEELARYINLAQDFVAGFIQCHGLSNRYNLCCVFNLILQDV